MKRISLYCIRFVDGPVPVLGEPGHRPHLQHLEEQRGQARGQKGVGLSPEKSDDFNLILELYLF